MLGKIREKRQAAREEQARREAQRLEHLEELRTSVEELTSKKAYFETVISCGGATPLAWAVPTVRVDGQMLYQIDNQSLLEKTLAEIEKEVNVLSADAQAATDRWVKSLTAKHRRFERIFEEFDFESLNTSGFVKLLDEIQEARELAEDLKKKNLPDWDPTFDFDDFEKELILFGRSDGFRHYVALETLTRELNLKALAPLRLDDQMDGPLEALLTPEVVLTLKAPATGIWQIYQVTQNPLVYRVPTALLGQLPWKNFREVASTTGLDKTDIDSLAVFYPGAAYPTLEAAKAAVLALKD